MLILIQTSLFCMGCVYNIPNEAFTLQGDTIARRQLQTRRFETKDELKLLQAGAALLQDLGFTIDESEPALGVIVGSKSRDATDAGQIVGMIVLAALTGASTPIDSVQNIRVLLVTRPLGATGINLRVTFQRVVINTEGDVARTESLDDPLIYQEFFSKLSKAVFLQANNI